MQKYALSLAFISTIPQISSFREERSCNSTMTSIRGRSFLIAFFLLTSSFFIYQHDRILHVVDVVRPSFLKPTATSTNVDIAPATRTADDETLDNLLRTQADCIQDYPHLYDAIDVSISHYENHSLQRIDLEKTFEGAESEFTWVVIRNNKLYVRSRHGGFQSRVQAVLADLNRAILTSPERLPDIEFLFNTADSAPSDRYTPVFGLSRGLDERAFLIPDFGYWAWPEPLVNGFTEFQDQADLVEEEVPWTKKKDQLFWRGNVRMNVERERLVSICELHNETWGNVRDIDWGNLKEGDRSDMADHCRYKFLAHVEGARYSARLKYLQHCNSVIVTHERQWTTHLSHLLETEGVEQNIVVVGPDFKNVEVVMKDLLSDEERAQEIAQNSQNLFGKRYGRLGAEVCYWRQLIRGYHSILTPEFQQSVSAGDDGGKAKDYESVMLMGTTEWGIV